jgi:hypothetical protein
MTSGRYIRMFFMVNFMIREKGDEDGMYLGNECKEV